MQKNQGFTLTELMIVVMVVGILVTVGMPAMNKLVEGRQLVGQATEVASALAFTRAEATSRSHPVVICSSSDGATCSGVNDWGTGWIIFADKDGNNAPTPADILKVEGAMNGNVTLNANASVLGFDLSGESLAVGNVVFHLCSADADGTGLATNRSRLITVNRVGSANIAMGTATCN